MHANFRSAILISILILLSMILSSCKIWSTTYLTPEVTGTVYDLSNGEPVEGLQVRIPDYDQTVQTDSAGHFKLEAITKTRFFTLILPGSAVRHTPVAAYRNDQAVAWGWAVNHHWAHPTAEIFIFIVPDHDQHDLHSETDPELAYLIELSGYLQEESNREKLVGMISPDYNLLSLMIEACPSQIQYLGKNSDLSYDEIDDLSAPFYQLHQILWEKR
jgi:hypothetical protein